MFPHAPAPGTASARKTSRDAPDETIPWRSAGFGIAFVVLGCGGNGAESGPPAGACGDLPCDAAAAEANTSPTPSRGDSGPAVDAQPSAPDASVMDDGGAWDGSVDARRAEVGSAEDARAIDAKLPDAREAGEKDAALSCASGQKACGARCVPNDSPLFGCAAEACDPCSITSGTAICRAGSCAVGSCDGTRADCNLLPEDGCETDLRTVEHCGDCTRKCATGERCSSEGTCVGTCGAGQTSCGGTCVDLLNDSSHCGACGNTCPTPTSGYATCVAGACRTGCNPGYVVCSSGCCPAASSSSVTEVAASYNGTCALHADGTVSCWGDVGPVDSPTPVRLAGVDQITALSSAGSEVCGLRTPGTPLCWGTLGTPTAIPGFPLTQTLTVGSSGGSGYSSYSGVGASGLYISSDPYRVAGRVAISGVTRAVATNQYYLAIQQGELVWGTISASSTVHKVPSIQSPVQLGYWTQPCVRTAGGLVYCGHDITSTKSATTDMTPVPGISGATHMCRGESHACAVVESGKIKCWGENYFGMLGDGTTQESNTPVEVYGVKGALGVTCGRLHTCGWSSGGAFCWGYGNKGRLGNGATGDSATPVNVVGL